MKEVLETSSLEEATGKENEEEMVQSVVDDFEKMVDELQEAIELAEEAKDEGTGDMLIAVKQSLKKHIWMLKAYLG
jgi:starvation-inducible DNA-binding protein